MALKSDNTEIQETYYTRFMDSPLGRIKLVSDGKAIIECAVY